MNLKKNWYIFVAGLIIFVLLYIFFPALAIYGEALTALSIFLYLMYYVDLKFIPQFDTFEELKKGNIAVGIYFLAIVYLFGQIIELLK